MTYRDTLYLKTMTTLINNMKEYSMKLLILTQNIKIELRWTILSRVAQPQPFFTTKRATLILSTREMMDRYEFKGMRV